LRSYKYKFVESRCSKRNTLHDSCSCLSLSSRRGKQLLRLFSERERRGEREEGGEEPEGMGGSYIKRSQFLDQPSFASQSSTEQHKLQSILSLSSLQQTNQQSTEMAPVVTLDFNNETPISRTVQYKKVNTRSDIDFTSSQSSQSIDNTVQQI